MTKNLIVRLRLRYAKWSGITRTKLENTSLSAPIIPYFQGRTEFSWLNICAIFRQLVRSFTASQASGSNS